MEILNAWEFQESKGPTPPLNSNGLALSGYETHHGLLIIPL